MKYILLALAVVTLSSQHIMKKEYDVKRKAKNQLVFSFVSVFFAMIFFLMSSGFKLEFKMEILPYSIAFAVAYSVSVIGTNVAISKGPLALSSMISSYAMLIPTAYGIIFLKEQISAFVYTGILFLIIALYLINAKKENRKFPLVWVFYMGMGFLGNGLCSTIQKIKQINLGPIRNNEFMILALAISLVMIGVAILFGKYDKKAMFKGAAKYGAFVGLANGATNLLILLLTAVVPNAVLFPIVSGGAIVLTFLVSFVFYKEIPSRVQLVGYVFGAVGVVLLSI